MVAVLFFRDKATQEEFGLLASDPFPQTSPLHEGNDVEYLRTEELE